MRINPHLLAICFGMVFLIVSFPPRSISAAAPLKWGAYAGWQVSDFANFQQQIGQKMNYMATFIHWGNENQFPAPLAQMAKTNNQTLVIYWEAMDYNFSPPEADTRFSYDHILAGNFDPYLASFAKDAQSAGVPVIIVPFGEMNSDWYPWSVTKNGNSPQKHIAAFRYLKSFFTTGSNVKFGWAINNDSVPNTAINNPLTYYPGDDVVDYVGVDGFNFDNPWQTFPQVFDASLSSLEVFDKPAMIFSMACADGNAKAAWIRDAATHLADYPQLVGWIWFNENKERDWRVWSDANSLLAFQTYLITAPSANITTTPTIVPSPIPTAIPSPVPTIIPVPTVIVLPTATPSPLLTTLQISTTTK